MSKIAETLRPQDYTGNSSLSIWKEPVPRRIALSKKPPKASVNKSLTMRQYAYWLSQNVPGICVGRQRLYDWFRKYGAIKKNSCEPEQEYLKNGLFDVRYADTNSPNRIEAVALITPQGQEFFYQAMLKAFGPQNAA